MLFGLLVVMSMWLPIVQQVEGEEEVDFQLRENHRVNWIRGTREGRRERR